MAAHHELATMIAGLDSDATPDVIIFSGPLNVPAMLLLLPEHFRNAPRVVYFHESQWTYPTAEDSDARPYLMQHLDAIRVCDHAWFNSSYHLGTFWDTATSPRVDSRIRAVASALEAQHRGRCRVVYPPVVLDGPAATNASESGRRFLLWNARWEADKRPDLFIALLDDLKKRGRDTDVIILGTAGVDPGGIVAEAGKHCRELIVPGHLESRRDYERLVNQASVVVSTADHEFFGIAVLEAVLSGAMPVLPDALAYPETIPSSFFYRHRDLADLVRVTSHALNHPRVHPAPPIADASRFAPNRIVPVWDAMLDRVARVDRSSSGSRT